mmetsp:Transcript_159665/g.281885  ORF Transcript_159665/g.281885 Transcript_159665/m.281885 type:complete len:168 (-) Transcript_159665:247-750(-)
MPYPLVVKTKKQQIIKFDVEESTTVADVKKKVQEQLGIPPYDQPPLCFNGKELEEGDSLGSLKIVPDGAPGGPIVHLGKSPWDPFYVYVELPSGKEFKVYVSISTTVAQLKGQITNECGVPYLMYELMFQGNDLAELSSLGDCGVGPEAKILTKTYDALYQGPAALV